MCSVTTPQASRRQLCLVVASPSFCHPVPQPPAPAQPAEHSPAFKPLTLRPIRPEDEPLLVAFHETLSEESVYRRYFSVLKLSQRTAHERLTRICCNDYDREIALVAEHTDSRSGRNQILGVARLSKIHGLDEAEFAVLITDKWQNLGLGHELLRQLIEVARAEKLSRLTGQILADNPAMRHLCEKLGFVVTPNVDQQNCTAVLALEQSKKCA